MAQIKLIGLEEVKREMGQLEPRLQKNALAGAVRKVAAEVRDEARGNVPVASGRLRKNIMSRSRRARRHTMRASVIVRSEGSRDDNKNAFYWRFVEFGHVDRAGNHIPGRHFISRAYESIRDRVDQIMTTYLRARVEKALKSR